MHSKRFTLVLLTLALILAAQCTLGLAEPDANFNATGYPICKTPVTITVAGEEGATSEWADTVVFKEMAQRLGIQWDISTYPSDIWATRLTLMVTSDELPDFIMRGSASKAQINVYGQEGYFLDIGKYLDYMPNLQAAFEQHPEYKAYHTAEDGGIYSLAFYYPDTVEALQCRVFINKEWLKNVNMEYPNTVDELYAVLKAFKEQDANGNGDPNDEIPLSYDMVAGARFDNLLAAAFGISSDSTKLMYQLDDQGKVVIAETTDNYKAYLTYMNRLYTEKLLDETVFIQSHSERREKIANDKVGMFSDWSYLVTTTCGKDGPTAWDTWAMVDGFSSEYSEKAYPAYSLINGSASYMINANTQYPEIICRLLDYMYTDEYVQMYNYGIEGETFDYVTTSGGYLLPVIRNDVWEGKYSSLTDYKARGLCVSNVMLTYSNAYYKICDAASDEELEKMYQDDTLFRYAHNEMLSRTANLVPIFPLLVYTNEESKEIAVYATDLSTYMQTMRVAFITGEADIDADWDTYQATLESMGLEELITIVQTAYDRYADNL